MPFTEVTREKSKLRLALAGVSGSGKTLSALYIAYGITGDWGKIAMIDTEHGRAKFYANRSDLHTGTFLYQEMTPPYSPEKYNQMVAEGAAAVGPNGVVIVDSFSHAWNNEGGILDIKSEIEKRPNKNSYTAWADAGKFQNKLVNTVLAVNCHTIVTMRVKMEYAMEQNERGKMQPVKIGLAPVQRDDTEYEFDVVLNISRDHTAFASKDTTFLDTWSGIVTPDLGKSLKDWLDNGVEPELCEACQHRITPAGGKTIADIATGTFAAYGKKLCWNCAARELRNRRKKEEVTTNAAAPTVSGGTGATSA